MEVFIMSLFNFGKKKEEKSCCCSCDSAPKDVKITNECCGKTVDGICCIKVLGAGCKACHTQYENTKDAVKNIGIDIEVEYITDMQKIMEYGVMSMPAIVVNDKVVSMGKVLKTKEVEDLFHKLGF